MNELEKIHEESLPSPEFLKAYLEGLLEQAGEKKRALGEKSSLPFSCFDHRFPPDLSFISSLKRLDFRSVFQFLSQLSLERVLFDGASQKDFECAQSALVDIYVNSSGGDKYEIIDTLIRGQIDAVKNWIKVLDGNSENNEPENKFEIKPNKEKTELHLVKADNEEKESVVYFVQNPSSKKIKIGFTFQFKKRIRALECGAGEKLQVLALIKGDRDLELKIHKRFEKFRCSGEWFSPDQEIIEAIEKQTLMLEFPA